MALISKTGKLGEGKAYRYRNGQSGVGMLAGWQRTEVRVDAERVLRAAPAAKARGTRATAAGVARALPVGNHGENV